MTARERLDARLHEIQIFAKKSLGQNFLVSDFVIEKIIKAVAIENPKKLIEIGPGCGALTDLLREQYNDFTLIELDRELAAFWRHQKMNVIEGDALQIDWNFGSEYMLVSNLPYQISSSLVIERSLDAEPLHSMVLMFQKEVAQRLRALKQTDAYGMLSVIAQEFWTLETVCDAGSREFRPAPNVSSRVLKFYKKESNILNKKEYLYFVKVCFQQRRRILKTNLAPLNADFDTSKFEEWLITHKKNEKIRVEELSPEEIKNLYYHLKVN